MFNQKPHLKKISILILVLVGVLLMPAFAQQTTTLPLLNEAGTPVELGPWLKIGLVGGVGSKPDHQLSVNGPLSCVLVDQPSIDVVKWPQYSSVDSLSQLRVSSNIGNRLFDIMDPFYSCWELVPESVRQLQGAVPYVSQGGVQVAFIVDASGQSHAAEALAYIQGSINRTSPAALIVEDVKIDPTVPTTLALIEAQKVAIGSRSNTTLIGTKAYRHFMAFSTSINVTNTGLLPINVIQLEAYLCGVVPKEVSASWPVEAIKAQAVAARTYALSSIGKYKAKGYDLTDDTQSQVYGGVLAEDSRSNTSVVATLGLCAFYEGKLIQALFHSNSGGYTENSEEAFSAALPYLRGKYDPYSLGQPNASWVVKMTPAEIKSALAQAGYVVGDVLGVATRGQTSTGRIRSLEITGSQKTVWLEKDNARKVFGYTTFKSLLFNVNKGDNITVLSANGLQILPSTSVAILGATQQVNSQTLHTLNGQVLTLVAQNTENSTEAYAFYGRGYGHGVGLSQYGAKAMAESAFKYDEILRYYYTDIRIEAYIENK